MRRAPVSSLIFISALLVIAALHVQPANGANILGVFLSPSPSHLIVHMSAMKALAERGHNITVVSTQKPKVNHDKIRNIIIPPSAQQLNDLNAQMTAIASKKVNIFIMMKNLFTSNRVLIDMQYDALKDKRFTDLYNTPGTKFDLLVMGYFMNDFQLAAATKFKCPIILSWTGPPMEMTDAYVGNPREAAYVPGFNNPTKLGEVMNFPSRTLNFLNAVAFNIITKAMDNFMEKYYWDLIPNDGTNPTYHEMKNNVSVVFCNSHSLSEGPIRPLVPALVEIGGIQVKEKPDPLPKDINDFMDAANKSGVILFSLGSNLKGSNINPQTVETIYKTLSSLKQNVIWKWEDLKNTPGSAKNILYKDWLPQDDILAHPNLKLFITHAGKGGVAEAQYHGVPMVALPVFADQHSNADKISASKYGLHLNMLSLKGDELKNSILEVLNNPVYTNNVKKFSQLYRDRPLTAKESVVFWTEYVIRHHGAAHMQSPLVHLNDFQSLSLDVMLFLCLVLCVVWRLIKLAYKAVRKVARVILTSRKSKKTKRE